MYWFKLFATAALLFVLQISCAYSMEIAITVDDLPMNGDLPTGLLQIDIAKQMLATFKKHHLEHIYGLVNGKNAQSKENIAILQEWVNQSQLLGNHTYDHIDLVKTDSAAYINNIQKNEELLNKLMGSKNYRYFRYPFLSEGNTQEKRDTVRQFLFKNKYDIAPVTVDFFEYEWNDPYVRCLNKHDNASIEWLKQTYIEQAMNALTIAHSLSMTLFNRDIKNVLLIHINSFTALMLDDLLTAYEKSGVNFISLPEALNDDVYKINPNIVRDRSYTFLNQVRLARNVDNPDIVEKLYATLPEEKLEKLCR